jgi:hypothetical protein
MQQYGKLPGDGHHSSPSGVASASGTQAETPSSQGRVFAVWTDDVVGTFNQQLSQVPITCFGDAKLRVAVAGLTASRPQAEITADIPTSLEAFLAAQRQNVRQCRELTYTVDLDECLGFRIFSLGELLDGAVVFLDLHCHVRDLME